MHAVPAAGRRTSRAARTKNAHEEHAGRISGWPICAHNCRRLLHDDDTGQIIIITSLPQKTGASSAEMETLPAI